MNYRHRIDEGKKGAYIGIIGNVLLFAIKLPLGVFGNSYALIAASFHTFADALSSVVVLIGFHAAGRPADEEHHYGHGDAEAITGLIVAMLIILIGFEVGRTTAARIFRPFVEVPGFLAVSGAIISITGNWIMAHRVEQIGKDIRSPSLLADSSHHASDALSSVVVLGGIFISMLGYRFVDPVAGLLVGLFIIKTGLDVGRENIDMLMGRVPDTGLVEEIKRQALTVEGVKGVHSVKIHYVGVIANVSLHIEVDKDIRVVDADRTSHQVQAKIVSELEEVASALVHVCPCRDDDHDGN